MEFEVKFTNSTIRLNLYNCIESNFQKSKHQIKIYISVSFFHCLYQGRIMDLIMLQFSSLAQRCILPVFLSTGKETRKSHLCAVYT